MLDFVDTSVKQRADLTYKFNKDQGRHGWLRLTPAYSVKLVKDLIANTSKEVNILDPFSGTATTGLVAAEHGNTAITFEINPFLIWLGNLKCRTYTAAELAQVRIGIQKSVSRVEHSIHEEHWQPKIYNIERWWSPHTLKTLATLRTQLVSIFGEAKESEYGGLAWVAFSRLVIETSAAAFNHQSMSFNEDVEHYEIEHILEMFKAICEHVIQSANSPIAGQAKVVEMDAREIKPFGMAFGRVITSPPYPNRMSYIRELRPYMYWTRFLEEANEAGELDWKAIGGTWGIASSRLNDWEAKNEGLPKTVFSVYNAICNAESKNGFLLGTYVLKYFHDMHMHLDSLRAILEPGAELHYIVGNSTFFGNMVDTASLLEESMSMLGYKDIRKTVIRKRNSKKELFEFDVSAYW